MVSRHVRSIRRGGSERRGSVLVLVIAVLAMLFVIGATQLMVARSERKTAEERSLKSNANGVAASAIIPASATSTEDAIGMNALAYDAGWNSAEPSRLQDAADFTGVAINTDIAQRSARSGDLLTGSLEPYFDPTLQAWSYYFMSWSKDVPVLTDTNADGIPDNIEEPGSLTITPNSSPVVGNDFVGRSPVNGNYRDAGTGKLCADADGDGIVDARWIGTMSGCDVYQRVISHGGMVSVDRMTHPALLAQVIHPDDAVYHEQPWLLFTRWSGTTKEEVRAQDEARLRRRFSLPGSILYDSNDWKALPQSGSEWDLRTLLPYTLGYRSSTAAYASHYWRVGSPPTEALARDVTSDSDYTWWDRRMKPGNPFASSYSKADDKYDRQHLLTTHSNDDLLRPVRDEKKLLGDASATDDTTLAIRQLYYAINPTDNAGTSGVVQTRPIQAYGLINPGGTASLAFNKNGLRTQFSLRDVLERSTGTGSVARAMQLTGYYLAMMQHTASTDGRTPADQLRMAAQLAVNTIDYADADPIPTVFAYYEPTGTAPVVEVVGIEKQPYITEAYAKVVKTYNAGAVETLHSNCVFAVELYNPYNVAISLQRYEINDISLDTTATARNLADGNAWDGMIPPRSYLLFVSQAADPTGNLTADNYPFTSTDTVVQKQMVVLPELNLSPAVSAGATPTAGLDHVKLERTTTDMLVLANGTHTPLASLVVDQLGPASVNNVTLGAVPQADPTMAASTTVRHTSLQRHKEPDPANPIFWHFTIAKQKGWESIPLATPPAAADVAPSMFKPEDYHKLLFTPTLPNESNFKASELLCKDGDAACDPNTAARFHDLAPMPIIVGDNGLDLTTTWSTTGCGAFPTTGTLLLVTMNGHTSYYGTSTGGSQPLSVSSVADTNKLIELDHNHMPLWNGGICSDINLDASFGNLPQGRNDMPWGQLVFSYFTALPLEELTYTGFLNAANQTAYEDNYLSEFGYASGSTRYSFFPLVDRVTDASSPYGPKVRGRINVNFAPWWVLDGMPALPAILAATGAKPPTGMPVQELLPGNVDPNWTGTPTWPATGSAGFWEKAGNRPAQLFDYRLIDQVVNHNAGFATISADFAQCIAAFREKRSLTGMLDVASTDPDYMKNPGYLTTGSLCNLIRQIQVPAYVGSNSLGNRTLAELRGIPDPSDTAMPANARRRPFSYIGYLQLIAPVVRLQDWATTRSHVYTVYNLIGDGNGTWLRSQTTIDRTRCLYTNDLPDRITQTEPIDYYNTVGDQQ